MELGLGRDEVRLVHHDETWLNAFYSTKEMLLKHTTLEDYQIEHIGSTAIRDIRAKPIIDILIGIKSISGDLTELEKELRDSGFYRLRVDRPDEIVLAKFTDDTFKVKTHYVHLVKFDGELRRDLIFFRDYLNDSVEARKEYEAIKMSFIQEKNEGIKEYTNLKENFVREILSYRKRYS